MDNIRDDDLAVERIAASPLPLLHHENGHDTLIVSSRAYQALDTAGKALFRANALEAVKTSPTSPDDPLANARKQELTGVVTSFLNQLDDKSAFSEENASYSNGRFSVVTLTGGIGSELLRVKATPAEDKYFGQLAFYHEMAHATFGRGEVGADYMAAVQTLVEHPESRASVQSYGNWRFVRSFEFGPSLNGKPHGTTSEYAGGLAVEEALSLPPAELDKLRNLSGTKRREILDQHAAVLDEAADAPAFKTAVANVAVAVDAADQRLSRVAAVNELTGFIKTASTPQSELRLRSILKGVESGEEQPPSIVTLQPSQATKTEKMLEIAKDVQVGGQFEAGSTEAKILNQYIDSVSHLHDRYLKGEQPAAPAAGQTNSDAASGNKPLANNRWDRVMPAGLFGGTTIDAQANLASAARGENPALGFALTDNAWKPAQLADAVAVKLNSTQPPSVLPAAAVSQTGLKPQAFVV